MVSNDQLDQEASFALWGTQGGGLARTIDSGDVWYELPEWMNSLPDGDSDKAAIGDPIPEDWGLIPANQKAQDMMLDYYYGSPSD